MKIWKHLLCIHIVWIHLLRFKLYSSMSIHKRNILELSHSQVKVSFILFDTFTNGKYLRLNIIQFNYFTNDESWNGESYFTLSHRRFSVTWFGYRLLRHFVCIHLFSKKSSHLPNNVKPSTSETLGGLKFVFRISSESSN